MKYTSAFAAVAAAFSVLSATDAASAQCAPIEENTDYWGNDITSTAQDSAEKCCADCANTPGCGVYVWIKDWWTPGTCYLKRAGGQKGFKSSARAAKIVTTVAPPTAAPTLAPAPTGNGQCTTIEENTDYWGNDIGETLQASADKCCADCAKTPGCKLYVWEKEGSSGRCYLKNKPANKAYVLGARAAQLALPPGQCAKITEDTDYPGNDLGDVLQLETVDLCCTACSNTAGCKAYVWVLRDNVGTCILKSSKDNPTHYPGARAATLLGS
ncbi:hypothetical protein As57867_011952, partial [Aphanomyces stellatus]